MDITDDVVRITWMIETKEGSNEWFLERAKYRRNAKSSVVVTAPILNILVKDSYIAPAFVEMADLSVSLFN